MGNVKHYMFYFDYSIYPQKMIDEIEKSIRIDYPNFCCKPIQFVSKFRYPSLKDAQEHILNTKISEENFAVIFFWDDKPTDLKTNVKNNPEVIEYDNEIDKCYQEIEEIESRINLDRINDKYITCPGCSSSIHRASFLMYKGGTQCPVCWYKDIRDPEGVKKINRINKKLNEKIKERASLIDRLSNQEDNKKMWLVVIQQPMEDVETGEDDNE